MAVLLGLLFMDASPRIEVRSWQRGLIAAVILALLTLGNCIPLLALFPQAGAYREILNSDSAWYAGSNLGNGGGLEAFAGEWMNRPAHLEVTIPPLAAVVLQRS